MDDRGTLLDPRPYAPTHAILQHLTPLWQHDIYTWDHLVYQPRGGPPRIMTETEFLRRRSLLSLRTPSPSLTKALKYL